MSNLKQYIIPFIGLKQGKHLFEYEIDIEDEWILGVKMGKITTEIDS